MARFLESQGFKEEAMSVTTDPDHKFDLSIELNHVDEAHALLLETPEEDLESTETMSKWKRLSDAALKNNNFELTEAASIASDDYSGLLLLYSATGNLEGIEKLAKMAAAGGKTNVAFTCFFLSGNVEACTDLLISTNRLPEAAFFVRTYLPSRISEVTSLWKEDLAKVSESAANALADPVQNPELFPDMDIALQVEKMFIAQRASTQDSGVSASDYLVAKDDLDLDLIGLIKARSAPESASEEKVPEEEMQALQIDPDVAAAKLAEEEALAEAEEEKTETLTAVEAKTEEEGDDFKDDW